MTTTKETVLVPKIDIQRIEITVVGDTPLICHRWSEKAKKEMRDKNQKNAKTAKEAQDPEQEYRESLYELPGGGYGFIAAAFKLAAVSACRYVDGAKMTEARGGFHVVGELLPIYGSEPVMREDMVRVGMGTASLRYRGAFNEWWTSVPVVYNSKFFKPAQIVNLFAQAGFGVGVGDWRAEKNGSYGRFHVATQKEMKAFGLMP